MTAETTAPDPTAVLVRRVIAYLLDVAIYAAAAIVPLALLADSRSTEVGESLDRVGRLGGEDPYFLRGDTVYSVTESDLLTAGLIALGVFLLNGVVLQGLTGRTIGKGVTGTRTVRPDGSKPGLVRAFVRELFWIIDALPYPTALVGGVLALVTTGHRRLGDFAARTYVVHRRFAGAPVGTAGGAEDTGPGEGLDEEPGVGAPAVAAGAAGAPSLGAEAEPPEEAFAAGVGAGGAGVGGESADDRPAAAAAVADDDATTETAWAPQAETAAPAEAEGEAAPGEAGERVDDETGDQADVEAGTPSTSATRPSPPRWDPARKAYISYDPRRGEWLQHDTETGEWGPISRA